MNIYRVTNTVNGKVYIGKWMGERVRDRWSQHRSLARQNGNSYFHNAIRKYGPSVFKLEVVYTAKSVEELAKMETFFIVLHQSHLRENGYNLTMGGDGGVKTAETRAKISVAQKKNGVRISARLMGNQHALGSKHTDEWKEKASLRLLKKPISTSSEVPTRLKISLALQGNQNSLGRRLSVVTRQRISASMFARKTQG